MGRSLVQAEVNDQNIRIRSGKLVNLSYSPLTMWLLSFLCFVTSQNLFVTMENLHRLILIRLGLRILSFYR